MWLPELYKRMNSNSGSICLLKSELNVSSIFNETLSSNKTCEVDNSIYIASLYSSLAQIPPVILVTLFIDLFGRKKFIYCSFILAAFFFLGIIWIKSQNEGVILMAIFGGLNSISISSLNVISGELYPTKLRSTASGIRNLFGRIGNTSFI
jgi:MFS family permease